MNNKIGTRIKEIRKQQKMTQSKLGALIGKKEVTIRKYENGSIKVPLNVLNDIAENLNISITDLIGIDINKVGYSPILDAATREYLIHREYLRGDITDDILTRYRFNETLDRLDFNCFEKNTNHFSLETQVAIYGMLDTYISTVLMDWYFTNEPMSSFELNNIFLISLIVCEINDYKDYLAKYLIEKDPIDSSNCILKELTPNDLVHFAHKKTDLLNSISKTLDGLISISSDINKEFPFEDELKRRFGDKYFKQSSSKSNTPTD